MAITKNILVTGAGSGIGRAIAQHLSKNNYDLVLLGRNSDHLEETRNSLECPEKHQCISCDIRLSKDIAKALEHNSTLQHLNLYGVCISYACARNTPVPYDFMHIYTHTYSRKQAY